MKHDCMRLRSILLAAALSMLASTSSALAQSIDGVWNGIAKFPEEKLQLVFHISRIGSTWQGSFDCPSQNAYNLSIASFEFQSNDSVTIHLPTINASFKGVIHGETLKGNFSQGGRTAPLTLKKMPKSK